jgi:signal transduction histidine kinase
MRWNPFAVSSLLAGVSSAGLGLLVLLKSENRRLGRVWCLFCLSVAIWGFGGIGFSTTLDPGRAFLWWHIAYAFGVIWIAPLFYDFVCEFLETSRRWTRVHYAVCVFWFFLLPSHLFFDRVHWMFNSFFYAQGGRIYPVFFVWWMGLVLYSHYRLLRALRTVPTKKRNQILYFLIAIAISFSGGCFSFLPNFGVDLYPWGNFAICLYPVIMSYAILKHQLMDVKVVVQKTLVYSAVSASLIAAYVATLTFISRLLEGHVMSPSVYSSAIAAGIIALLFQPLQSYLQHQLDRRFPRESLDQDLLREATGDFVHEIKRPLANISVPAQLALRDLEEFGQHAAVPRLRQKLEFILRESLEAGQTIEAIRAISSRSAAQFQPVNLKELFQKLLDREQPRISESHIKIVKDFSETDDGVKGDAKQLEIAFGNIVKNAIDALQEVDATARRLRVAIHRRTEGVVVDIEDTGKGIAKTDVARLFDPWFSTKGASGMGIGLFLTREILRLHNASIEVDSQEGQGSRFRVTFS